MNLHYSHTRTAAGTQELERAVLALFETYQRLDADLLSESLSSGRMSGFLFEADEAAVEADVKAARDAAIKKLDEFEQVGVTLKSKAINEFVKQMRSRLAKVTLDSGRFRSLKDFAGITVKQMSFVGDGISQAIKDVDSAVDALVASLETLKIDYKTDFSGPATEAGLVKPAFKTPLAELIEKNKETSKMSVDKFKQGIQQKMAKSTGEGAGFFSQIMSMFKGSTIESIVISSEQFAQDLLACTGEQIEAYLKGPAPAAAKSPAPAAEQIQQIVKASGVDRKSIEAAKPAGTKVTKFTRDEWSKVHKEVGQEADQLKDELNKRSQALFGDKLIEAKDRLNRGVASSNVLLERWEKLAGIKGSK